MDTIKFEDQDLIHESYICSAGVGHHGVSKELN